MPIYGDGKQIRDWLYVDDHNRGVDLIIKKGTPGQTYNIGGSNEWANIDIVNLICELIFEKLSGDPGLAEKFPDSPASKNINPKILIEHVKDRAGHDRRYAIDAGQLIRKLDYSPAQSFETGIRKALNWFFENEKWWNRLLDDSYKCWIEKNYIG